MLQGLRKQYSDSGGDVGRKEKGREFILRAPVLRLRKRVFLRLL